MKRERLTDIAHIERAKKGKIYPAGIILIQLSASRGQCLLQMEDGEVDARYAVVQPTIDCVPYYLWNVIQMEMPEFCAQWQTGINLQFENLKFLSIPLHSFEEQKKIADKLTKYDAWIQAEQKQLDLWKGVKKNMLDKMFI